MSYASPDALRSPIGKYGAPASGHNFVLWRRGRFTACPGGDNRAAGTADGLTGPSPGRVHALRTAPDRPDRGGCMARPLKVAVQMDPIESINIDADSTFA